MLIGGPNLPEISPLLPIYSDCPCPMTLPYSDHIADFLLWVDFFNVILYVYKKIHFIFPIRPINQLVSIS